MCRMLVAVGKMNMTKLIGGFLAMARDRNETHEGNRKNKGEFLHKDGWGAAWLEDGKFKVVKSTKPCYKDSKMKKLRKLHTSFIVLHARKVSCGPCSLENTHPLHAFVGKKEYVFCHNGTLNDFVREDSAVSDSRIFFQKIANQIGKNGKEEAALKKMWGSLKDFTGANVLLCSPQTIVVGTRYKINPKYYTMKLGKGKEFVVVSSEVLPKVKAKWRKMKNKEILTIDPASLAIKRS